MARLKSRCSGMELKKMTTHETLFNLCHLNRLLKDGTSMANAFTFACAASTSFRDGELGTRLKKLDQAMISVPKTFRLRYG
jgi:hypothetical protein